MPVGETPSYYFVDQICIDIFSPAARWRAPYARVSWAMSHTVRINDNVYSLAVARVHTSVITHADSYVPRCVACKCGPRISRPSETRRCMLAPFAALFSVTVI